MAGAPDRIKAALVAAFDIYALYNKDMDQVTIRASITEDTPRTIAALLADPRTDDDTSHAPGPGPVPASPPLHIQDPALSRTAAFDNAPDGVDGRSAQAAHLGAT
jgi:hypothetical protein